MSDAANVDPDPAPEPDATPAPDAAPNPDAAPDAPSTDDGKVIWPEKWRESVAGDDAKKLTRLGRFDHPGTMFDSYLELEQKFATAEFRTPFPEEGSDAEKAVWRGSNDVPAEAAGYMSGLPDGMTVGEEDKAGMDTLTEAMHAANAPVGATHAAMGAYYKHVENVMAERAEMDDLAQKNSTDALNELYGSDYRRNINDLNAWLDSAGEEVKTNLMGARTPDGTPLASDPGFIKWMVGQMRDINPIVTIPGLGGGDPAAAVDDEIAAIEKTMTTDFKTYSADAAMQSRYQTLLVAREKRKS